MMIDHDNPQPPFLCCIYNKPYKQDRPTACTCGFIFGVPCESQPSNDSPPAVQIEIRAAELAVVDPAKLGYIESMLEWAGRVGYPDTTPTSAQAIAAYLACEIRGAR